MAFSAWLLYGRLATGFLPEMDEGGFVLDYVLPPGMSLDAGTLRWTPPAGAEPAQVIVLVSDSTGQETYHTFKLRVGPPRSPGERAR